MAINRRKFLESSAVLSAGMVIAPAFAFRPSSTSDIYPLLKPGKQGFTQDALPYTFDALEPYIDKETMKIHFEKHHTAYITNLNKAYNAAPALKDQALHEVFSKLSTLDAATAVSYRNNGGGHWNHSFFWNILSAKSDTKMSPAFEKALHETFNNTLNFKAKFKEASMARFGSGWTWLVVNNQKKLTLFSTPNQDNPLMDISEHKGIPVLGIDLWEHAYYLKHQNKRADYIDAFWNVVDWAKVSEIYEKNI